MTTLLLTLIFMLLAFAGIGIKILIKKNGKFSGTCASQNPSLNKDGTPCGFCGKMPDDCENED